MCLSRGCESLEQLNEARIRVKAAIRLAKKLYNRNMCKGVAYLKKNYVKNSWIWFKTHFRISKKNLVKIAVCKHSAKNVVTEPFEVLNIWTVQF